MKLDIVTVGDSVVDLIIPIPELPIHAEDVLLAEKLQKEVGGAANFLIIASRLGLKVGVIDYVGDDDYGSFYIDTLKSEGVDTTKIWVKKGANTTLVLVLADRKGTHAFIGVHGAGMGLLPADVDPGYVKNSRALYLSGYSLMAPIERNAAMKALYTAEEAGIPIFFDPGPILHLIPSKVLLEAIGSSEAVLPNLTEAKMITRSEELKESSESILKMGAKTVVVKLGEEGCFIATGKGSTKIHSFPVKVVDTTGAGDAFNAAFIYGYLKKWALEDAGIFANAVGALKVTKMGAGTKVPTKIEVRRFLEERNLSVSV